MYTCDRNDWKLNKLIIHEFHKGQLKTYVCHEKIVDLTSTLAKCINQLKK